jgi:hypothetical protein
MNEYRADESFLKLKSHYPELALQKLGLGDRSEYASAENMAVLPTNDRKSLLANRYQLQQILGQGGFGRTFLALDRHCFDRMLQDNPSHRYQTAAANLTDLEQLLPASQATIAPINSAPTVVRPQLPIGIAPLNTLPTAMRPQISTAIQGNSDFIAQCEQESIEYLGPIGKFLVQNAIAENPQILPAELIDLLAKHIPQTRQVDEFRRKLYKFTNN